MATTRTINGKVIIVNPALEFRENSYQEPQVRDMFFEEIESRTKQKRFKFDSDIMVPRRYDYDTKDF